MSCVRPTAGGLLVQRNDEAGAPHAAGGPPAAGGSGARVILRAGVAAPSRCRAQGRASGLCVLGVAPPALGASRRAEVAVNRPRSKGWALPRANRFAPNSLAPPLLPAPAGRELARAIIPLAGRLLRPARRCVRPGPDV